MDPKGVDIAKLHEHMLETGGIKNYSGFTNSGPEILEADADILIPAAMEGVINENNASRIKTPLIIEAANGPITAAGDTILRKKGVIVIPDFCANAGGVTVSYFEWIKNLTHIRFGRMQRRQQENQFEMLIQGVESMTGQIVSGGWSKISTERRHGNKSRPFRFGRHNAPLRMKQLVRPGMIKKIFPIFELQR